MNLHALKRNGVANPELVQQKLTDTQDLLQQTMEIVHRFARELRPTMLDELGLLPALRSYLKGFAERTGLRVHFRANLLAEQLDGEQKTVVFRVAQESLTNVAKHAQARRVDVTIRKLKNAICMEVVDDGRSFRENADHSAASKKRLGLLGMQERVRLVDGQFAVKPDPGRGTTVRVILPFTPSRALAPSQGVRASSELNLSPRRPKLFNTDTSTPLRNRYGKNQSTTR
jgi:signal transduction histidine kinase